MARELRRRSVPHREVMGLLGHGARKARTTEWYVEYDPAYLSAARRAIAAMTREPQDPVACELRVSRAETETKRPDNPLK